MNAEHLHELVCPACRGELQGPRQAGEIENGQLECKACAVTYPISGGIPRMLQPSTSGLRVPVRPGSD